LKLKIDLHVHTNRSPDGSTPPKDLPALARQRGLDGYAITDHNILSSDSNNELLILPGVEISTRDGHVIGLGISKAIPRGLSADETIRRIRDSGGVSIIAHPYDLLRSAIKPHLLTERPNAIEVINSASFLHSYSWTRARKFAEKRNYPMTGGSDSHIPDTLGRAYTEIESESKDAQSVLASLRAGRISPFGSAVGMRERLRKRFYTMRETRQSLRV
jgi:predicted metal-dependent phosphoesterase TrpH